MTLTPRGVRLRERLQHIFAELEQVFNEVSQTQELTGVVRLAASTTSAAHFVPRKLLVDRLITNTMGNDISSSTQHPSAALFRVPQ